MQGTAIRAQDTPGPGEYSGTFTSFRVAPNVDCSTFGATSHVDEEGQKSRYDNEVPGPGTYNVDVRDKNAGFFISASGAKKDRKFQ